MTTQLKLKPQIKDENFELDSWYKGERNQTQKFGFITPKYVSLIRKWSRFTSFYYMAYLCDEAKIDLRFLESKGWNFNIVNLNG